MADKSQREVEKDYPKDQIMEKLRRLADSIERGERFAILMAGERIYVPARAQFNIEHERGGVGEEIEFQVKWSSSTAVMVDPRRLASSCLSNLAQPFEANLHMEAVSMAT